MAYAGLHSLQTNNHVAHAFTYADATARAAASGFATTDLYKLAIQQSDNSVWMLTATTSPAWKQIDPGGAAVASVNTRTGAVTLVGTDIPAFVASGASHAPGAVPDPGGTAGTTKYLREDGAWQTPPGTASGTVTSVALTVPGVLFSVSGGPVTTSGTLALSLLTQTANTVLAGPASGAAAAPTFRALAAADLPASGVGAGATVGSSTLIPVITYDASGRITAITTAAVSGGGSVSGSGAANQLAYWTGASALGGDAAFTVDASVGSVTVTTAGTGAGVVVKAGSGGYAAYTLFYTPVSSVNPYFRITGDATLNWGAGSGATDTDLFRFGSGILKTSGTFRAAAVNGTHTYAALSALGSVGASATVNWASGNTQTMTLTAACTLTFSGGQASGVYYLSVLQDATGGRTITWPSAVKWPGGTAPTLTATASKLDLFQFVSNGTSYFGSTVGLNY